MTSDYEEVQTTSGKSSSENEADEAHLAGKPIEKQVRDTKRLEQLAEARKKALETIKKRGEPKKKRQELQKKVIEKRENAENDRISDLEKQLHYLQAREDARSEFKKEREEDDKKAYAKKRTPLKRAKPVQPVREASSYDAYMDHLMSQLYTSR